MNRFLEDAAVAGGRVATSGAALAPCKAKGCKSKIELNIVKRSMFAVLPSFLNV
jgi:hypothetical protein